ncbi:MAG: lipid-binding SYLF domain-containing protein [Gemmataceae bacterium]
MKSIVYATTVTLAASLAFPGAELRAQAATLQSAAEVLDAVAGMPTGIPPAMLREAQAVAILPGVIKAAFVFGGRHGKGVLMVREPNNTWGRPVFISLTGGGVGWQIGLESTDLVLVFMTRSSVNRILEGKGKITLGADVGVAAGPIGRQAEAATDAQLKAEIYSYSRSRGLFAGVSLQGGVLLVDHRANEAYYNPNGQLWQKGPLASVPPSPAEEHLRAKLTQLAGNWTEAPPVAQPTAPPVITPAPTMEPTPILPPPTPLPPPPAYRP